LRYTEKRKEAFMPKSTITSKGQTTIPKAIRHRLALDAGDVLIWEETEEGIRVSVASRAFTRRRGTIRVGPGSVVEDVRNARSQRGLDKA
jgi:AbrB family looped-hinge helix DNA binding protein